MEEKKKRLIISIFNFIKIFFAFSRTKKYISLSIKRIKGTPQALSLGLATGIAISFTPFIGLHALLAIFISWVIGGSMAAALIGTLFGNPWTFPFFFYLDYKIGVLFYFEKMKEYEFKLNFLVKNFEELFFPTFFGSIPVAILVWLITYYLTKKILEKRLDAKKNKIRS